PAGTARAWGAPRSPARPRISVTMPGRATRTPAPARILPRPTGAPAPTTTSVPGVTRARRAAAWAVIRWSASRSIRAIRPAPATPRAGPAARRPRPTAHPARTDRGAAWTTSAWPGPASPARPPTATTATRARRIPAIRVAAASTARSPTGPAVTTATPAP